MQYTIIGSGKDEAKLKDLITTLQADGYITLAGQKTSGEIASLLHLAHIFLLPSITAKNGNMEGFLNATKEEALALGLPVIVTNHSGTSELVDDGISEFLVPEHDVEALVNRLNFLLKNPKKWAVMVEAKLRLRLRRIKKMTILKIYYLSLLQAKPKKKVLST